MIKIIKEGNIPRATVSCFNCNAVLEYGNSDLWVDTEEPHYSAVNKYYLQCPCCNVKIRANWIINNKGSI